MPDRKTVISGLHCRAKDLMIDLPTCDQCEYRNRSSGCSLTKLCKDALDLLNEQNAHKPVIKKTEADIPSGVHVEISLAQCGFCGFLLEQPTSDEPGWNFCPRCGQAVKWNG